MMKADTIRDLRPGPLVARASLAAVLPTSCLVLLVGLCEFYVGERGNFYPLLRLYLLVGAVVGITLSPLLFLLDVHIRKSVNAVSLVAIAGVFGLSFFSSGNSSPDFAQVTFFPEELDANAPDIVLITIDTLRADRWQQLAPTRFEGVERVEFERVWSTSGLTAPAHASLFSGNFVHQHGVGNNGQRLGDELPILPATLAAAGWHTMAANSVLHLDPAFGFARGSREFSATEAGFPGWLRQYRQWLLPKLLLRAFGAGRAVRSDRDTIAAAKEMWSQAGNDQPRFMWLHLFGPHWPYPLFGADPGAENNWPQLPTPGFSPAKVKQWRRAYDRGVDVTANAVRHLVDDLHTADRVRPLWIVITADHGEYLGEHGASDHGDLMYEEGLRVPLWVIGPQLSSTRIPTAVSHVDMLPSLLELAGLDIPTTLPGRSWLPAVRGKQLPPRPIFAETRHPAFDNAMCVIDDIKLVRNLVTTPLIMTKRGSRSSIAVPDDIAWLQGWEAYDLRSDPNELNRLQGPPPRAAAETVAALEKFLASRGAPPAEDDFPGLAPEVREALRILGYH